MELSNEIIAKVISPYIGCMCLTNTRESQGEGKPFKFLKGKFLEIDLGMMDSFIGLLLENETEPSNHENYSASDIKLILKPLSAITDSDAIEVQKILGLRMSKKSNQFKDICNAATPECAIEIYQFLQNKGYDMPHYLLGIKTLKEVGLAIYEEELN
jgi:hypothetical protein